MHSARSGLTSEAGGGLTPEVRCARTPASTLSLGERAGRVVGNVLCSARRGCCHGGHDAGGWRGRWSGCCGGVLVSGQVVGVGDYEARVKLVG